MIPWRAILRKNSEQNSSTGFVIVPRTTFFIGVGLTRALQVFFCTKSSEPITLRPSVEADYLQSFLREKVLSTITQREFDLNVITRDLEEKDLRRLTLTDEHNPLMDWQEAEAVHHWKLMRDVLPPVYWETY